MLCDSVKTVMDSIQRRFAADAQVLTNDKKRWFIDMRKQDDLLGVREAARQHKKKLSTFMMFTKESKKMFNGNACPWNGAIRVPNTSMFVLVEHVPAKPAKEAQQGKPAKVQRVSTKSIEMTTCCRQHEKDIELCMSLTCLVLTGKTQTQTCRCTLSYIYM